MIIVLGLIAHAAYMNRSMAQFLVAIESRTLR
jgi:hypothetical protein